MTSESFVKINCKFKTLTFATESAFLNFDVFFLDIKACIHRGGFDPSGLAVIDTTMTDMAVDTANNIVQAAMNFSTKHRAKDIIYQTCILVWETIYIT